MNILEQMIKAIKEDAPPPSPIYQAIVMPVLTKHQLVHAIAEMDNQVRASEICRMDVWEQSIFGIKLIECLQMPLDKYIGFKNSGKAFEFVAYTKMHGYDKAVEYFGSDVEVMDEPV